MTFLIHVIMLFLLFNGFTADKVADSLIEKSCKESEKSARNSLHYYNFCVKSIKQNPESQKVRNIDELTVVGTNNAIMKLLNVKGIMEMIVKERKYKTNLSKKLLQECIQNYSEAYISLNSALKYLKEENFRKTLYSFIDAKAAPIRCDMKFNDDNRQIFPLKKENDVLFVMIEIPHMIHFDAHHRD